MSVGTQSDMAWWQDYGTAQGVCSMQTTCNRAGADTWGFAGFNKGAQVPERATHLADANLDVISGVITKVTDCDRRSIELADSGKDEHHHRNTTRLATHQDTRRP